MAKKTILLITGVLLIGSVVFAGEQFWVEDTLVGIDYIQSNGGGLDLAVYTFQALKNARFSKPTSHHLECLRRALGRYETRRGEVYEIIISPRATQTRYVGYVFICEFTSNTVYNYWFIEGEL
jgi:hypothetical protein